MNLPSQVLLASNNPKKLAELRRLLQSAGLGIEVLGLRDVSHYAEPEETERTFEGNAFLKAETAHRETGLLAVADDSGLEVEELGNMPGVRSARWAGPACDDEENNALLLAQLDGVPAERRTARFVCALAMVGPGGQRGIWYGRMPGRIAEAPAGDNGFGYDPLFIPAGLDVTSAQLTPEQKDSISHRGIAVRAFIDYLTGLG